MNSRLTATTDIPQPLSDSLFKQIEGEVVWIRLWREIKSSLLEFRENPRDYFQEAISGEPHDRTRRRRVLGLVGGALVVHVAMVGLVAYLGFEHVKRLQSAALESRDDQSQLLEINMIEAIRSGDSREGEEQVGVSSGGGGGDRSPDPVQLGVRPPVLPHPQIVDPHSPAVDNPLLAIMPNLTGPISEPPPPPDAPIGTADGVVDGSKGSGTRGGVGSGTGTGIGNETGPGSGSGPGGPGGGGGPRGTGRPDGTGGIHLPSEIDFRQQYKPAGYVPFAWLYRARPVVSREAQEAKVFGEVLLRVTIRADGTVDDIEVLRPIDHMEEAAKEALRRSRFRPAMINGVPITTRNVPIRIRIDVEDRAR